MHRSTGPKTPKQRRSAASTPKVPRDYPWEVLGLVAKDLCEQLGMENELSTVLGVVRSRDVDRLQALSKEWSLRSIDQTSVGETRYLLSSLIRKYPLSHDKAALREAALSKLREAELTCSAFNTRGWKALFTDGHASPFLMDSREFVERVLGNAPETGWLASRHGPGADTDSHGLVSLYDKYSNWPYHVTRAARGYARQLIASDERWLGALEDSYRERFNIERWRILDWEKFWDSVLCLEETNKVTTVPKDGRTDRPIAIEPRMNLMLQLGIEGVIRQNLKRWGIDLDSQVQNQLLAREGSLRKDADTPVTLDLSNASDTVSLRIVKLLFPKAWYELIVALRSPKGIFPNSAVLRYSKLSSMGNGATFAIEALVFASACYAASKYTYGRWLHGEISVFGDDIVVPQAMSPLTRLLLEQYGFIVNEAKSFEDGNRRESCGTDWVAGINVRPVFLWEEPVGICAILNDLNRLTRWAALRDCTLPATTEYLMRFIPQWARIYGPLSDETFDGWIHSADPRHRGFDKPVGLNPPAYVSGVNKHPWTFRHGCISEMPIKRSKNDGKSFFFRKLMAQLRTREVEEPLFSTKAQKLLVRHLKAGGSVFDLLSKDTRVCTSIRYCHSWQTEYHNYDPRVPKGTPV